MPFLEIDADLLVVKLRFALDDRAGSITQIDVGPIEGYTPDPGMVKAHKSGRGRGRGKHGNVPDLSGFGGT